MRHTGTRRAYLIACWFLFVLPTSAGAADGSFVRNGVELHYRTEGTGKPIVFLSGGPGLEVDYMAPVAEFVPATYARVLFEQRGTGRSRLAALTPETLSLRLVVEDLEGLRAHLKQDRLFLVGHSWGGMLAMAYAAAHPERVDRLVLIGPGGPTLEFTEWFPDNIRMRLRPEDLEAERYWDEAATRGVDESKAVLESLRAITPGYFFDRAKGLAYAAGIQDGSVHGEVNAVLFADLRKGYDSRPGLRKLRRPVLIVQGHQDPVGDKTAEEIHRVIAGSVLKYIKQAGHFPWIEQPDEFRHLVSEFLGAPTPRR